jgi:ribosome-binding protein aMBF1 (putative translation factor)
MDLHDRATKRRNHRRGVAPPLRSCVTVYCQTVTYGDKGVDQVAPRRIRLALRRKAAGFSQESLAERLRVDRTTVVL